jgi:hypothetical protein
VTRPNVARIRSSVGKAAGSEARLCASFASSRRWIGAHRGDVESQHRELERLVAADPANLTALDRLAQIAEGDGQTAHAAGFLCTKAKIGKLRARY